MGLRVDVHEQRVPIRGFAGREAMSQGPEGLNCIEQGFVRGALFLVTLFAGSYHSKGVHESRKTSISFGRSKETEQSEVHEGQGKQTRGE